jgi:hypothetical protein
MINTSLGTTPANPTTVKRMTIILILAFVASQINLFVDFLWQITLSTLNPDNTPTGLFYLFSYNPEAGTFLAAIVFLLLCINFLTLSLYPEHGWRQVAAGFLGAVAWIAGRIAENHLSQSLSYDLRFSFVIIGTLIAIPICLLASGRVKSLSDLAGLGLGLLIGAGVYIINLYFGSKEIIFAPIWLSAVFFLELFSRRASHSAILVGALLWIGLMMLAPYMLHLLAGG